MKRRIFITMLLVFVLLFSVVTLSVVASTETQDGMTFGENSYFDQEKIVSVPSTGLEGLTFETELCIDHSFTYKSAAYAVFGNFVGKNSFDLLIRNGQYVELYVRNASNGTISPRFSGANIQDFCGSAEKPAYCKISLSVNFTDKTVTLYLKGKDATGADKTYTATQSANIPASVFSSFTNPIRIGGDLRSTTTNSAYFVGKTRNVAMYTDIRTEAEVSADMAKDFSVDSTDPNLLFAYDLTDTSVTGLLTDLSANKNNAKNPHTYVDPDNGFFFSASDNYDMEAVITPNGSMTFEAEVTLPADSNTARLGWLVGNYINFGKKEFGVEFQANRKIRVFMCKGGGSGYSTSAQFTLPSVSEAEASKYRKIAFTISLDGSISFYIDGALVDTVDKSSYIDNTDSTFFNQVTALRIGGDYRGGNSWYLRDIKVKNVAMYEGISETAGTTDGLDAMFYYDLTDTTVEGYFSDLSGNSNDAIDKNKFDITKKYDYSFAIVGDTQYMTKYDAGLDADGNPSTTEHLKQVYDWLLANKDKKNIKYVMGLGDITDTLNSESKVDKNGFTGITSKEWEVAYAQISRLNGVIPYSQVRGNHDNADYFNQYFDTEDYKANITGVYPGTGVLNAYNKFEVGTQKYLLLLLDDKPTDAVVEWANEVISSNPDYRVIINTHTYMGHTGELIDSTKDEWLYCTGNQNIANGDDAELNKRNDGQELWDNLVSKHENIMLVLCGHDYNATNIIRTVRIGDNGNAVNQMLICPQSLDGDKVKETKSGMVAMFYFSNKGMDMRVEYVKTAETNAAADGIDVYHNAETNNKAYKLLTAPVESEHGLIYPEYIDAAKYPFVVFSESGSFLGGFETLLDTVHPYNNGGAIYAAKVYMGANVWSDGSYGESPKAATIVVRSDYILASNEAYDNMAQFEGTVTIDLDGHTLTASDSRSMFPSTIKTGNYESHFAVINGKIKLSAKPLIAFSGSSSGAADKPWIHSFTNVEFIASSASANLFSGYAGTYTHNPSIIFNDCTFDLTCAPAGAVIFNLGDGYIHTAVSVNGGEFIFGSDSLTMTEKSETSLGTIAFAGYNGDYLRMTLPASAGTPDSLRDGFEFVEESTDGTLTTYVLMPSAAVDIDFTPMASITLDSNLIFNIYIPNHEGLTSAVISGIENFSLNDYSLTEDGKYYIVPVELSASEAAKKLVLTATLDVDGTSLKGSFTFSIPRYAEKVLADTTTADAEETLVKDVLSYIRSAYAYFGTTDAEAMAKIDELLGENYDETSVPVMNGSEEKPTLGITAVTYNLDAKPALRFYLADSLSLASFTFSVNGSEVSAHEGTDSDGKKYIEVELYAYELAQTVDYTVNGEPDSCHIKCYYEWAKTQNNDNLVKLVERFAKYCESAKAYRESVIN